MHGLRKNVLSQAESMLRSISWREGSLDSVGQPMTLQVRNVHTFLQHFLFCPFYFMSRLDRMPDSFTIMNPMITHWKKVSLDSLNYQNFQ